MSDLEPPVTVTGIERLTNERRTTASSCRSSGTAGVAHDVHVEALRDPLDRLQRP